MALMNIYKENQKPDPVFERVSPETSKSSDQFLLTNKGRDYQKQYFHIYSKRLEALRERIGITVRREMGRSTEIKRLSDLDDIEEGKNVVVIGTLFKTQILKPNILKEVGEENAATNEELQDKTPLDTYIDATDELVLEDELQRARLHFTEESSKFKVANFVSGIVCGVLGSMIPSEAAEGGGKFKVQNIFLPDFADQVPRPKLNGDRFIALISGIEISGESTIECLGGLELAASWLLGEAGDVKDHEKNSKIERLVIAGNSLSAETRDRNILTTAKYLTSGQTARSVDAVNAFDEILQEFASGMDVDLMPGANDPANQIMPQQPLHCCLFPRAAQFKTLKTVPNPYYFEASGVSIVGTSGQNVDDVMKNSDMKDPLEALESLVRWSHIAPTCPDTLGCFPFTDKDPFVIEKLPHIFFAGNQEKYASKKISIDKKEILLVTLPKFAKASTMALLSLKDLNCQPLVFSPLNE